VKLAPGAGSFTFDGPVLFFLLLFLPAVEIFRFLFSVEFCVAPPLGIATFGDYLDA
jgi:hypothetical protein